MIRGTKKSIVAVLELLELIILSNLVFLVSLELRLLIALLLAHSNAISVFPVPVLYIIDPRWALETHASIAAS
jgi:hypothetical protein